MTRLKHCLLAGAYSGLTTSTLVGFISFFLFALFGHSFDYVFWPLTAFIVISLPITLILSSIYSLFVTKSHNHTKAPHIWGKFGTAVGIIVPIIFGLDNALAPSGFPPFGVVPWHVYYAKVLLIMMVSGAIGGYIGGRIGGRKLHSTLKLLDATEP